MGCFRFPYFLPRMSGAAHRTPKVIDRQHPLGECLRPRNSHGPRFSQGGVVVKKFQGRQFTRFLILFGIENFGLFDGGIACVYSAPSPPASSGKHSGITWSASSVQGQSIEKGISKAPLDCEKVVLSRDSPYGPKVVG